MTVFMIMTLILPGRVTEWEHYPHYGGGNSILSVGDVVMAGTSGGILFARYSAQEEDLLIDSGWTSPVELTYDRVSHLVMDSQDNLWVSYGGGGIDMFTPSGEKTHFNQIDGLPLQLGINQTLPDSIIYAATTQGLCIREFGYFETWDTYSTGGGLPSDNVNCIMSADSGLYVGTTAGLTFLPASASPADPGSWELQPVDQVSILAMALEGDTLWAASAEKLFRKPPGSSWEEIVFPSGSIASIATGNGMVAVGCTNRCYLLRDGDWYLYDANLNGDALTGLTWVGDRLCGVLANTYSENRACGSGLALLLPDSTWRRSFPDIGPVSNDLRDCTLLSDGTLWVTSNANGGSVLAGTEWISLYLDLTSRSQCFAVCPSGEGAFVSSIGYGIDWLGWNGSEVTETVHLTQDQGLVNNRVFDASQGDFNTTWFAHRTLEETEPSGVSRLIWTPGDPTSTIFTTLTEVNGLPSKEVNCILASGVRYAWAGTEGGLVWIDGDRQSVDQLYTSSEGLPSSTVTALDVSRGGDLFIGTPSGPARLSQGSVQEIAAVNASIDALACDGLGSVWFGTSQGLKRYFPLTEEVEEYSSFNSPLPDCTVYSMTVDMNQGFLWLATDHGLWRGELESSLFGDGTGARVYPNPFLPGDGEVLGVAGIPDSPALMQVFDLTGALVYEYSSTGRDDFAWDGTLEGGGQAASGAYILVLTMDGSEPLQLKFALVR